MCIHAHAHLPAYILAHSHSPTRAYTHACTYTLNHSLMSSRFNIQKEGEEVFLHIHTRTNKHENIHALTYIDTRPHVHMHIHTHTRARAHTHTRSLTHLLTHSLTHSPTR